MSVLETFHILFKSDSKEAEKGIKNVKKAVKSFSSEVRTLAAEGIALFSIYRGIKDLFSYGATISQASMALKVNADVLDSWGHALERTGGNLSSFQTSLSSLAYYLNTTPSNALKVLPRLADQFKRLNQAQAVHYGKILGLDMPTILLLQRGSAEIETLLKRQKDLGVTTQKQVEIFRKFQFELQDTKHAIRTVFFALGEAVLPVITKIMHGFEEMAISLRKHSGFIKGALFPLAVIAGVLAAGFIAANAATILIIAAVTALGVAVGLLWDDVQTFFNGGDSLIGLALERWPKLGEAIKSVAAKVKGFGSEIADVFKKFGPTKANMAAAFSLDVPRKQIATAENFALGSMSTPSILNSGARNSSSTVQIDTVTVNTQATDAKGISQDVGSALKKEIQQAQNDFANGVQI